ncbi:MAG: NADH-quinone oxidoreductase subunit J [Planctomycetales bacterium]|nr:NADH-quinone oxidoreductase subunit J [Planctomycetales bacterium]
MSGANFLFWVYALAAGGSAIAVVLTQNVVRMAFWLIVSLGSTAGLFFLLGADFVGAAQLLVYVGGTLVLLIFGVMLTASGPFINMKTNPGELVLAGVVGCALLGVILSTTGAVAWDALPSSQHQQKLGFNPPEDGSTLRPLGMSFIGLRPDKDLDRKGTSGQLSTGYLLPFEIVSVHLLVVLVGAAYLARAKRRQGS